MRLKLTLEYDGTGFRGWAAQPGLRTVEDTLRAKADDAIRDLRLDVPVAVPVVVKPRPSA